VKKNKKTKPVKEYLELQGRFSHLTDEEINNIQQNVDRGFEKLLRLEEFGKTHGEI
jgi:pyruvate/2-oxoacid:ferredoxin oxidoreductase beta subunit